MTERPILFSAPMIRAILEGRKTQTRRIVSPQPPETHVLCGVNDLFWVEGKDEPGGCPEFKCPHGVPDQRLWVRETFQDTGPELNIEPGYVYRATDPDWDNHVGWKWTPSIFMPRKASRITLEIVKVRVERVQQITGKDALAEGILRDDDGETPNFRQLWDSINAQRGFGWDVNPWVFVIEFKRLPQQALARL